MGNVAVMFRVGFGTTIRRADRRPVCERGLRSQNWQSGESSRHSPSAVRPEVQGPLGERHMECAYYFEFRRKQIERFPMPSPFPGMDPYIERAAIWPDFHDRLIAAIVGTLQPALRPKYAALAQDRLYLVESERPIYPDVAVVTTGWNRSWQANDEGGGVAVFESDAPIVCDDDILVEELREPFIEIIEPAAGGRVVTAIEVVSPTNKSQSDGRNAYVSKRWEYLASGAHLVEIDLLRAGPSLVNAPARKLEQLRPWDYVVSVTRQIAKRRRREIYAFALEQRLPRLAIPLANDDPDVVLDLNVPFMRCWDEGPYPMLLKYHEPPPGELAAERVAWCEQRLRAVGLR